MMRASLIALLLLLPALIHAEPIRVRTTAHTQSTNFYFNEQNEEVSEVSSCAVEGTTIATCDLVVPFTPMGTGFGTEYSAQFAEATAAFGSLHGEVYEYIVDYDGSSIAGYTLTATAEATDMITLSGDTGTGYLEYLFKGQIYSLNSGFEVPELNSSFQFQHDGGELIEVVNPAWRFTHATPSSGDLDYDTDAWPNTFTYMSALFPFTWDHPFEFYMYGRAMTHIHFDGGGNGYMDATFDGFRVFDANQQRVNGYRVTSAANAAYATAVPEPATLLTLGAGLAVVGLRRARPRRLPAPCLLNWCPGPRLLKSFSRR